MHRHSLPIPTLNSIQSLNLVVMEVEVKLRLPDAAAHQLLSDALTSSHRCTHLQENIFFDGLSGELSAAFAALQLRFYGSDTRCVLSLKSRPVLSAGISRVEEIEEDIDPSIGRACVAEPWRLIEYIKHVQGGRDLSIEHKPSPDLSLAKLEHRVQTLPTAISLFEEPLSEGKENTQPSAALPALARIENSRATPPPLLCPPPASPAAHLCHQ